MNWWDVLAGVLVSWPPTAVVLYLGRKKLDNQTSHLTNVTDAQTDWLRPGWRDKNPRL